MSHMVIFRTSEGKSGYHQAAVLEEAVRFVERLRNSDGVEQAHIFRMEEVPFEFKPYYRVEVAGMPAPAAPPPAPEGPEGSVPPSPEVEEAAGGFVEPSPAEPTPVEDDRQDAGARRGLFGR